MVDNNKKSKKEVANLLSHISISYDPKNLLIDHKKEFFVAYNRRFFDSVIKLIKLCELDKGITSMHFEFTEWDATA